MKRSPLFPIFLIVVVDVLGLTIMLPLLAFYAEHLGATPFIATVLFSTYAACQLISGPLFGRISDRVGRRPLLLVSQVGTLIGFFVMIAAAEVRSLPLLFLARIIDGSTAGNLSLAQAYISDVTLPKNRARAFGVIGVAFGIGFLFGPAISGFLSRYGYQYPIFAAAALSFTSIMATYFLLPSGAPPRGEETTASSESAPPPPAGSRLGILDWSAYVKYFEQPGLASLLLQFFLFALCFSIFTGGFALFAERRYIYHGKPFGAPQVGAIFAYVGFLGIILQGGLIGRLVKRFGEAPLIVSGFLSVAIGYGLLGFTYRIPTLLAVATIASFGNGVLRPALTSLITQAVSRAEQGTVLGLNQSLQSIAQIVGPLIAGGLINRHWLHAWALAAASVAAIGLVLSAATRVAKAQDGKIASV